MITGWVRAGRSRSDPTRPHLRPPPASMQTELGYPDYFDPTPHRLGSLPDILEADGPERAVLATDVWSVGQALPGANRYPDGGGRK